MSTNKWMTSNKFLTPGTMSRDSLYNTKIPNSHQKKSCFKAVLKCPLTKTKLSIALLKLNLTKVYENWMHNYRSENVSNDIFRFSVSIIELEFQPTGFLVCHFYPKIGVNERLAHFNSVLSNTGWFKRQTKNTVQFSL